jgi:peptide-methionine (R)-S-oxide reductase
LILDPRIKSEDDRKIKHMKDDKELDPLLKQVAREKGTEPPYSGKYVTETAAGTYACAVCGNQLFASDTKFETKIPGLQGWPSFDQALPGAVKFEHDPSYGMNRTEVVCANCDSHLGHVFDDESETKTGKHYCINSVCLDLKKKDDKKV